MELETLHGRVYTRMDTWRVRDCAVDEIFIRWTDDGDIYKHGTEIQEESLWCLDSHLRSSS